MLTKTITYEDYNGLKRTETFYFNLTKSELVAMEHSVTGGLTEMVRRMTESVDTPEIMSTFREIVLKSYGEKSPDGKRLIKSPELSEAFSQTPAYDVLFMELFTDTDAVSKFVNGILPSDLISAAQEQGLLDENLNAIEAKK